MCNWDLCSPWDKHWHLSLLQWFELHRQRLQPITSCLLRAISVYLQRLGKNNTDNSGALLKRETACLQHNVEYLLRNGRAKAHTCRSDPQGQCVGCRRDRVSDLTCGEFRDTHSPWGLVDLPVYFTLLKKSGRPRGGERSDLTPPQTSGASRTAGSSPGQRAWLWSLADLCLEQPGTIQEAIIRHLPCSGL